MASLEAMKGCNNNLRDYMGKESVESGRILVILYGATSTSTSEMKVEKRHSSLATENVSVHGIAYPFRIHYIDIGQHSLKLFPPLLPLQLFFTVVH